MPALIEMTRLFGNGTAKYNDTFGWLPCPDTGILAAGDTFCSLASSAATSSPFKTLVSSGGWLLPTEGTMISGSATASTKRGIIRRWAIPDSSATRIQSLQEFLSLQDGKNSSWITSLQSMANTVNRFFPGSTNLSKIDPISNVGSVTECNISRPGGAVTFVADTWIQARGEISSEVYGYDDTEQGRILTRIGLVAGTLTRYSANTWFSEKSEAERTGPFFFDDTTPGMNEYERKEQFVSYTHVAHDPLRRVHEQVSSLYDPTAKHD